MGVEVIKVAGVVKTTIEAEVTSKVVAQGALVIRVALEEGIKKEDINIMKEVIPINMTIGAKGDDKIVVTRVDIVGFRELVGRKETRISIDTCNNQLILYDLKYCKEIN